MKSGSRRVFRYSSTHEKEIPDGSFRRRMELHSAPSPCPQRAWTAEVPRPSRDPKRRLLRPKERLPMALAPPRLPSMAHRLLVLQKMAYRWHLGEHQPGHPRTPARAPEKGPKRDPQPSAGVVDSQSAKSTGVGGEQRGYDGGKKVKGLKSATSWWIPRASCSR